MIQKEWKRVFHTRAMLLVILLFLLVQGALLVYTEQKSRPYSAAAYRTMWRETREQISKEGVEAVLASIDHHILELKCLQFFMENNTMELFLQSGMFEGVTEEDIYLMFAGDYPGIDIPALLAQNREKTVLRHTESIQTERQLYASVAEELRSSLEYPEYRQSILTDAEKMLHFSMFAKPGTFGYRNIEATLKRYQHLTEISTAPTSAKGAVTLFQGSVPGVLLLFFVLYLCIPLYLAEKEQGTVLLTRTCVKGRKELAKTKLMVLLGGAFVMQLLVYGVRFFILEFMYGLPELSRSIQSVSGFHSCVFQLTIGQYFLSVFIFRYAVLCFCALCMAVFCVACADTRKAFAGIAVFMSVQVLLYYGISANASYGALHLLNLWGMFRFDAIGNYLNLNLFGRPADCLTTFLVVIGIGFVIVTPTVIGLFGKKTKNGGNKEKKQREWKVDRQTVSVLAHEGRKLFMDQKVLFILLAVLVIQVVRYRNTERALSVEEVYYQYYMEQLTGPLTPEKAAYMEEEAERFRKLHEATALNLLAQKELDAEQGFLKAYSRYQHIKKMGCGEFFYDTGYRYLLAEKNYRTDMMLAIAAVILLTFTGAGLFGMDAEIGMFCLLTTARNRKKGVRAQLFLGSILTVLVWLLVYLPDLVHTIRQYGAEGLTAPACSIELIAKIKRMPLLWYLICIYLSRLLGLLLVSSTLNLVAYYTKSIAATIFGTAAVFTLPAFLLLLSERMVGVLFPYAPLSGNMLRRYPDILSGILIAVYLLAVLAAGWSLINRKDLRRWIKEKKN